jgi:hypothetical protein
MSETFRPSNSPIRKPDPARTKIAAERYGGTISSSGNGRRVIRRQGVDGMTRSSTAAVIMRTSTS